MLPVPLSDDYFTGVENPTFFDARCTRFLGVKYDDVVERTLEGGADKEILEWCFQKGRRPTDEDIENWSEFLRKRGWRDGGSDDLRVAKQCSNLGDLADIQTWFDLHDAEEDRPPQTS